MFCITQLFYLHCLSAHFIIINYSRGRVDAPSIVRSEQIIACVM
jgi:hypothetical protein